MNGKTESGAMPAKVLVNIRPTVTAGLANDVDEVKNAALPIQAAIAIGMSAACFL
jgi:hypothetical protein